MRRRAGYRAFMVLVRTPLLAMAALAGGCVYLEEQRVLPEQVYWSGTVLDGPYADDVGVFADGSFEVTDLDGALVAEGVPYEGAPGDWYVEVPVGIDVAVRLSGDGYATTVFRDRTPTGRAYWYNGALFVRSAEDVASFFDELATAGLVEAPPASLSQGELAHLWGAPLDPAAWAGATITVTDGAGATQQALALTTDDTGAIVAADGGDVDLFLAFDLAPGTVTVDVSGDGGAATWTSPALGGDLLHPIFFNLGHAESD